MDEQEEGRTEYPWVAELRAAGINVRTGTGHLNRVPDAYFAPPPWYHPSNRARIGAALRTAWKGVAGKLHRLTHPKRHAAVP
jgi:hypothetical protein